MNERMRAIWNAGRRFWTKVGHRLTDERYIFELRYPERLEHPSADDSTVICYRSDSELRDEARHAVCSAMGPQYHKTIRDCFSQNARLYLLHVGQLEVASLGWVKSGRDIPRWMIPLEPDDFVLFKQHTVQKFRGRHLMSHCIAATYAGESESGKRCFADCNVHNLPSIRQLSRTGFEIVARAMPPK